jgi:Pvc16 N-terminal domain
MSASTVISDVTLTLEELLKSEQRPASLFDVSLKSPADEVIRQGMKPKVNLFLYRVTENAFARNQEKQALGPDLLEYPPLWLNVGFLLTPFAEDKLDELRVLGEAMRVLHDNSIVSGAALKGALENTSEELQVHLCQFSLEQVAQIWTALDKAYRLSVCYEVRTVFIDSLLQLPVSRVLDVDTRFSQLP